MFGFRRRSYMGFEQVGWLNALGIAIYSKLCRQMENLQEHISPSLDPFHKHPQTSGPVPGKGPTPIRNGSGPGRRSVPVSYPDILISTPMRLARNRHSRGNPGRNRTSHHLYPGQHVGRRMHRLGLARPALPRTVSPNRPVRLGASPLAAFELTLVLPVGAVSAELEAGAHCSVLLARIECYLEAEWWSSRVARACPGAVDTLRIDWV